MTDNRESYQSVSLKQTFFKMIQQHIARRNPRYNSVADFIRQAVLEKIDRENYQPTGGDK